MTQDEIISMMKEAGFYFGKEDEFMPEWEHFFALAFAAGAAHEREACAKVCEGLAKESRGDDHECGGMLVCVEAIRARSSKND